MPLLDEVFNGHDQDKLVDLVIYPEVVEKKLRELKSDKAAGDDNISPRFLKAICNEIAGPVAIIFRKCLDTGQIPQDWRSANITPVFKRGRRSVACNYQPISLTSQICKTIESVIRDEILAHLEKYDLISSSQHGFQKGYSCGSNLLSFLEMVTAAVDAKEPIDTICLDLVKAFDMFVQ